MNTQVETIKFIPSNVINNHLEMVDFSNPDKGGKVLGFITLEKNKRTGNFESFLPQFIDGEQVKNDDRFCPFFEDKNLEVIKAHMIRKYLHTQGYIEPGYKH